MEYTKDMKTEALQDNLYWMFLQASMRAKRGFLRLAEEYDLTFVQLYTLLSMEPGKPQPMKVIARLLNCDPSNVTGIIDRLFSGNYIERQENPDDRRIKMISLTPAGEKLRAEMVERIMTYRSTSFEELGEEKLDCLHSVLKHILSSEE